MFGYSLLFTVQFTVSVSSHRTKASPIGDIQGTDECQTHTHNVKPEKMFSLVGVILRFAFDTAC
jgi:hypothetical protein